MNKSKRITFCVSAAIVVLQVAAIVLSCLPVFGLSFLGAETPDGITRIIRFYGGYDFLPMGYGNYQPILMLVLSAATAVLAICVMFARADKSRARITAMVVTQVLIAVVFATAVWQIGEILLYYMIAMPIIWAASAALTVILALDYRGKTLRAKNCREKTSE